MNNYNEVSVKMMMTNRYCNYAVSLLKPKGLEYHKGYILAITNLEI